MNSGHCDCSGTRWFDFWPFATMNISPKCLIFVIEDSSFCQIRNKLSGICQRLVNFYQRGEISPKSGHTAL